MPTETNIGWTVTVNPDGTISPGYSSNPIKYRDRETGRVVWACVKKSSGCTNCYSEALALRWNKGQAFSRPNIDKVAPFLDEKEMKRLATDPKLSGKRVFIGDMTDIFGSWIPDDFLDHLFAIFAWRQDVTFQLLTKRPARMAAWFAEKFQHHTIDGPRIGWGDRSDRVFKRMQDSPHLTIDPFNDAHWNADGSYKWPGWPLPNVWLGTSVENQAAADVRIPHLMAAPAAVRFLSCEPLLGRVDLGFREMLCATDDPDTGPPHTGWDRPYGRWGAACRPPISWVIVGGESGPKHRPMDLPAALDIIEQCKAAGVSVFVKQDSGQYPGRQGRIPDEMFLHQFPAAPSTQPAAAAGVGATP